MKKEIPIVLLLSILISGCNNSTSNSSNISSVNSGTSSLEQSSSDVSSKEISSPIETSSSSESGDITIDFVVNKLNETTNNSYTLNYGYQGVLFNDVFVPNSYYYNDLYKQGKMLANLFGNNEYLFDFEILNNEVNITNQSYNETGFQGVKELTNINLSDYNYDSIRSELSLTSKGIKLDNQEIVNFFTMVINDVNTFDYIIFNKYQGDLTIDFYYEDTLYDGYSYILKNVGNSSNEVVEEYLLDFKKLTINGSSAINTFDESNIVIDGDINYISNGERTNFESLSNIKIEHNDMTKYKLESISNGVSYKQYYTFDGNEFKKVGLDGMNKLVSSSLDIVEEEIFPNTALFMKDCYLIDDEYIYLGSQANEVIDCLLVNSSSIIIDAWIKEIRFKISNNKIESFTFKTFDTTLNEQYVYFEGQFNLLNNGIIEDLSPLSPSKDDNKIKELLNSISSPSSNYILESTSYTNESKTELAAFEKHIINYVDGVYFDANYRINNDSSLTMQFGNGYSLYNDKVYSFRYDVTLDKVDNVRETEYSSIQEAVLSLASDVLYIDDNKIKVNSLVTDVGNNVRMLEQSMLIDPSTLEFSFNDNQINKITYKYGNSYTTCYIEANITYNEAFIDERILTKLEEAYPKNVTSVDELYLNDSENENVISLYNDLYEFGYGDKANYIPFIPGIENSIEILWLNYDYPEGYQYIIDLAPQNYLDIFKDALVNVYGYRKINDNNYINNTTGLKLIIDEDFGYQQFYFVII